MLNKEMKYNRVLLTGAAGFIGYHLSKALLDLGFEVLGLDNINNYYDPELKYNRLKELGISRDCEKWNTTNSSDKYQNFKFIRMDLLNLTGIIELFQINEFDIVINLAAQAGVRYSIENPELYIQSNIIGFSNLIEISKNFNVKHFIYASSSSVYGLSSKTPFSENDRVDNPISLYAATKKSNELIAHSYNHLFGLSTIGLRFFTVYGPFGRPDMAYYSFTKNIYEGLKIDVYNNGDLKRDFTYIDDIIKGIIQLIEKEVKINKQSKTNRIYNIGNNEPVSLRRFISAIEASTGIKAIENNMPMQPGDVNITFADISQLQNETGFKPTTSIEDGIVKFIDWYRQYYKLN